MLRLFHVINVPHLQMNTLLISNKAEEAVFWDVQEIHIV